MTLHRASVILRDVLDSDLPIFFEHQLDPQATRMANFPSRDRDAFFTHWAKVRAQPANIVKTIQYGGEVAGNICCWPAEEKHLVGYWIGREFWNRGIATAAVTKFIRELPQRPLYAYVAPQNRGSIRVLEKCGFKQRECDISGAHAEALEDCLYLLE